MKNTKKFKEIPIFKDEDEERDFWATHDTTDYINWDKAQLIQFPNLKRSTRIITIRLPESLLDSLKVLANKRDVPYQSLIKILLAEKVKDETETKYSAK